MALSDEPAETVEPYLAQLDVTSVIVGSGSNANGAYGVSGIPTSFIIGPDGKIAWQGHPSSVSKGVLKDILKGAKKPSGGMFGVRTDFEVDARVKKAQGLAADGKLGSALTDLTAILADAKATEQQKTDAAAVRDAIVRHTDTLANTAENLLKARDVGKAMTIFEAVAKELGSSEPGINAKKRVDAIKADKKLMEELDASKAFDKLRESTKTLASDKKRGKYEEFAKKYTGTKAAERAKTLSRAPKS